MYKNLILTILPLVQFKLSFRDTMSYYLSCDHPSYDMFQPLKGIKHGCIQKKFQTNSANNCKNKKQTSDLRKNYTKQ